MKENRCVTPDACFPEKPIDRVVEPLTRFLHVESASGIVLLATTVTALILANSSLAESFVSFWKTPVGLTVGTFEFRHPLKHWINDGLMAVFFFVVGLEVKREIVVGELRGLRQAALPVAAALGGMLAPAMIYLYLQWGAAGQKGWGIPMATDIAFVVGCLAVLGPQVPRSLRVLLLSLAIVDDIGAILVIAIGYSSELNLLALALGFAGIASVVILTRLGVRSLLIYVTVGAGVWLGFHESGIHATIAGVILGLLTPARPWVGRNLLTRFIESFGDFLQGESWKDTRQRQKMLISIRRAAQETMPPLDRIETVLHPWVGFFIMPLFAFANAGVSIEFSSFTDPVAAAIVAGLGIGKPIGIFVLSWLAVRVGLAQLTKGVSWGVLAAGGFLAGIGFTMSLFIAGLALSGGMLEAAKIGILTGSAACALVGMVLLHWLLSRTSGKALRPGANRPPKSDSGENSNET
jgi:Na+:H+ antiporter, NhaA family